MSSGIFALDKDSCLWYLYENTMKNIHPEEKPELPNWQKYPMERVIMNRKKHAQFVSKCKKVKLPKSRVMNILIEKWLKDEVSI